MGKVVILLGILAATFFQSTHSVSQASSPGTPVWNIAADNNRTTNTIESKVCNLQLENEFSGTFTALDVVLSKMCIVASKAELLATQIDVTELNFNLDLSKLCAIEDNLNMVQLNLESFDTHGTFTALEGLKQTVCSKIELLNQQLSNVQTEIIDLTTTEIDHAATIVSQLEILDAEVISINSILDTLNFDPQFTVACSLLDVIDDCLHTLESKIDLLDSTIQTGFVGTFTALDLNLAKACTIESLVDAISMSFVADLSRTFSALNALQEKMCTIESKVDDLDMSIMSIESGIDILDSTLDPLISKLCTVESKTDAASASISFSLFDNAIQVLDQECSILEELNGNQMLEKSCTIESNLDVITTQFLTQESKLEIIDNDLQTVASKICAVEMDNTAISKLCLIDSKLDMQQNTEVTIESLIDTIAINESNIDLLDDLGQTIFSKLCLIEDEIPTICSKFDVLSQELHTIDSKLDLIDVAAQSSFNGVITIESRIDAIPLDQLVTNTLISKLCLIEEQVCTIESALDIMGPLIGILNVQAQDLICDFQETWTILQVIEDKVCTSESVLDTVSDKLQSTLDTIDFSGVFTANEAVDQKAITVDVQVNVTESLIDNLEVDFSGVFTVLEVIQSKLCLADDLVQTISSGLEDVKDCLGTAIFQSDVGTTGFVINSSGRYYLAENIVVNPTVAIDIINIQASDVFLDLNGRTISQANATSGVRAIHSSMALTNLTIANGTILNTSADAIRLRSGNANRNITLRNLVIGDSSGDNLDIDGRNGLIMNVTSVGAQDEDFDLNDVINLKMVNCLAKNAGAPEGAITFGDRIAGLSASNAVCKNCIATDNTGAGFALVQDSTRIVFENCKSVGNAFGFEFGDLLGDVLNDNIIIGCESGGNGVGIRLQGNRNVVMNNACVGNASQNIFVDRSSVGASNSTNNYIAYNSSVSAGTNGIEETGTPGALAGPNTYLGNFSGNSSTSNYAITDSNTILTNKIITITQTSSFTDRPTEWHNINMLS